MFAREEQMLTPEDMREILGRDVDVPYQSLVDLCDYINNMMTAYIDQQLSRHQRECPAHHEYKLRQMKSGTPEWMRLHSN